MKYIILILMLICVPQAISFEKNYGIYSNMKATEDGHFGGYEVFYTPHKLVFQIAEGWPTDPIILNIENKTTNQYLSKHPEMGKMILTFTNEKLEIYFVDMKCYQVLKKGKSFWQY